MHYTSWCCYCICCFYCPIWLRDLVVFLCVLYKLRVPLVHYHACSGHFSMTGKPLLVVPAIWFFVYVYIQTKLCHFSLCRISKFILYRVTAIRIYPKWPSTEFLFSSSYFFSNRWFPRFKPTPIHLIIMKLGMHLFLVLPYRFLFGIFQKLEKVTTHHGPDSEIDSTDFKLTYVVMEGHPFCVKCPLSYIKKKNYIRLATVKRAMLLILVLPHRCFFRIFLEIKKKTCCGPILPNTALFQPRICRLSTSPPLLRIGQILVKDAECAE